MPIVRRPVIDGCTWSTTGAITTLRVHRGVTLKLHTYEVTGGRRTVLKVYRTDDDPQPFLSYDSPSEAELIEFAASIAGNVAAAPHRGEVDKFLEALETAQTFHPLIRRGGLGRDFPTAPTLATGRDA